MEILQLLHERTQHNNYDQVDDICDKLEMLIGGNLKTTPVFYRSNMIIVRRSFLNRLFYPLKSLKMVRAVIYLLFCLLVVHTPTVPIRKSIEGDDSGVFSWTLCDYQEKGITRDFLIQNFSLDRNTFATVMSILISLEMVVQLPDGRYAFAIDVDEDLEKRSLAAAKDYIYDLLEILECFQQADLLAGLVAENDDDPSDEIIFANEAEAAELVLEFLDNCTIERWLDELHEVIEAHDGNFSDNAVAAKVKEFIDQKPLVSGCGDDFCIIRQELLEYIVLHGYRKPLLAEIDAEFTVPKSAMVVFLYMLMTVDDEGYMRNNNNGYAAMQAKEIARNCALSEASVSKAISFLKEMNVVEVIEITGVKTIKFCNRLLFYADGEQNDYIDYRKHCLEGNKKYHYFSKS